MSKLDAVQLENYKRFLSDNEFSDEQIKFLVGVKTSFDNFELDLRNSLKGDSGEQDLDYSVSLDNWERDNWYTMNQSGLFDTYCFDQSDTRLYITEIDPIITRIH